MITGLIETLLGLLALLGTAILILAALIIILFLIIIAIWLGYSAFIAIYSLVRKPSPSTPPQYDGAKMEAEATNVEYHIEREGRYN